MENGNMLKHNKETERGGPRSCPAAVEGVNIPGVHLATDTVQIWKAGSQAATIIHTGDNNCLNSAWQWIWGEGNGFEGYQPNRRRTLYFIG